MPLLEADNVHLSSLCAFYWLQSYKKSGCILYRCYLLPMSIGCVHTPWDLPSCLTSPVVPGELILPHWGQNILVHVKEVGPSPWRTWSGMAAGTEHFGTVELLAICYSGSDSIISAKDPPQNFKDHQASGVLLASVFTKTIGCVTYSHRQLQRQCFDQVLGLYFVLCIEDVFESW